MTGVAAFAEAAAAAPGAGVLSVIRGASRSIVCGAYATSPLRLLTPANHGHAAWVFTSSYGGGLVDGDRVRINVDVGEGAAAFLSTQASTKIYRSPHGTEASLSARVAADGLLVVAPDPVVCFAGARYRQVQRFELADSSSLVVVDWLSSGRRAFGERWMFRDYETTLTVSQGGRLLVHDALALRASDGSLSERLGRFDVLAIVAVVGARLRDEASAIVAQVNARPVTRSSDSLMAASPLGDPGCVVRIAGTSIERVRAMIRDMLRFTPALLGDDPWARKW
jgi:urease accessory protein